MANCDDVFPEKPDDKYRFFNQPIEQIPEYDASVAQMLFHAANGGLVWQSLPSGCVTLLKCVEVDTSSETYALKSIVETIRPLQIVDNPDPTGCLIPSIELDVVTCIKLESNNLVIERQKILVLNSRAASTGVCPDISTIECSTSSST